MSIPTENAKQHLIAILQEQPEDSSYDELIKELALARMISRGLKDVEAGRVTSNDEVHREIASWRNQK
jgi:predicted transcriptional regulator